MKRVRKIKISGGHVVLGYSVSQQDILITGEKISAVGDLRDAPADQEIDARNLIILPGAVDTHVHFNDEFMDTISVHDYDSGTRAAAFGGVTTVVDFSNQKANSSLVNTIDEKKEEASGKAIIDWAVHPVITEPSERTYHEIPLVIQKGAPTIKCYLTYRQEGLMVKPSQLKEIMTHLKRAGGMLMVHAEDNTTVEAHIARHLQTGLTDPIYHARSRPPKAENIAIETCIKASRETSAAIFIVHMASGQGLKQVAAAQAEGLPVYAETCTHYLIFTEKMLKRNDGIKWICSPPLRNQKIQKKLWQALQQGPLSMVTSDDAAYSWQAKLRGRQRFDLCPNGIPGIEARLPLLYSEGVVKKKISLPRMVELLSTNPARFFGLYPQKGSLYPGSDADIILFDPQYKWTMDRQSLHMATD